MDVDRRRVLQSIVGSALAALKVDAPAAATTATAPSVASFAAVSMALTGYAAPSTVNAAKMLAAFGTAKRRAALSRLTHLVIAAQPGDVDAALRAQRLDGIADELVAAWYSGLVTQGNASKVVLYTDAYMWSAMSFTKPIGRCGGVTNHWADPPK
ncbi:MAG TPA: sugar dehydrogenase complex small subunit [Casimicrobiaceae bacterium]|nr:sugar dehydrogenase complex small subunit [Casimicrobiaceae bacterium]